MTKWHRQDGGVRDRDAMLYPQRNGVPDRLRKTLLLLQRNRAPDRLRKTLLLLQRNRAPDSPQTAPRQLQQDRVPLRGRRARYSRQRGAGLAEALLATALLAITALGLLEYRQRLAVLQLR